MIFRKYFIKISRHLTKHAFSKHLELVKCFQVCSYLFSLFFPFLCKGVTSPDLRHEGKVEDLIELFMLFYKKTANISTLSLIILVEISKLWDALFIFKLYISFSILVRSIYSKANFILFLQSFWIGRVLRRLLYFRIALKVGSSTWFFTGSKFEYWFISKCLTLFLKKVLKTSPVSKSIFKISPFFNLLLGTWFISKWRFYYLQKKLIIRHFFLVEVRIICFTFS